MHLQGHCKRRNPLQYRWDILQGEGETFHQSLEASTWLTAGRNKINCNEFVTDSQVNKEKSN